MEEKRVEVKSLPVPSVQELVSSEEPLATIPPRYVCPEPLDPPILSSDGLQVPIIDIQLLLAGDPSELQRLHSASCDWGFFQAVNHGVNCSVIERFKKEVKDFFNIPAEEKKKYWQKEIGEGFGQAFVVSEEQHLEWADTFIITTLPLSIRHPRLFPSLPSPFRDSLECYSIETQKLASKIIDCLGQALGEETWNYFKEYFEEKINQAVRINYYPPCPEPEKVIGLSPHSDGDALTILLQVNEVAGLQIRKDGNWFPITPLPDAFIVNIGDMLEILSNGVYRSIEHRAMVNRGKERLSVATFHNPGLDLEIGPSPSLVTPENPAKFRRIATVDYLKGYFARKLEGKSYLDVMRNEGSAGVSTD